VVVTAIGCPLVVAWYARRLKNKEAAAAPEVSHAV
jgi:2-keto-3-deoxygluconate permease